MKRVEQVQGGIRPAMRSGSVKIQVASRARESSVKSPSPVKVPKTLPSLLTPTRVVTETFNVVQNTRKDAQALVAWLSDLEKKLTTAVTSQLGQAAQCRRVYVQHQELVKVLSSDPFHGVVWMLLSIGIIGNILVVVWRLAQKRDQRSSPLSILIIMLAVSDFLYCVHLLLLESLVLDVNLNQTKHLSPISARNMCMTSALLSWFTCLTAQWATFNITDSKFVVHLV
ncbi:uncharacterized protein LOC134198634 [Corticium candelabrum]|uniref:uncharacterized protein LOC134198634 n=1 Tax=Corticium candelabrum TaxID=121492 RepID=UPI002E2659C2|nr:uncharacterized protein LOC134198634 [Corticium candelabrum]